MSISPLTAIVCFFFFDFDFVNECPYKMFYIKMFCCDQAFRLFSFGILSSEMDKCYFFSVSHIIVHTEIASMS